MSGGSGDVSLSVEETNRLRAKLGLAPLAAPGHHPEEPADDPLQQELARRRRERQQQPAADDREKRTAASTVGRAPPRSLGESLLAQGDSATASAATWVTQGLGRAEEERRRLDQEEALRKRRQEAQAAYDGDDIRDLRVAHGIDGLEQGDEVILTLKDTGILAEGVLNMEDDELENSAMVEREKTAENNRIRQRKPLYDVYGEDPDQESELLAKYGEPRRKAGVRLGDLYAAADAEANRDDDGRKVFSLDTQLKLQGEFKPVKFKRKKAKGDRKETKSRSTLEELLPEAEAAARQEDHSSREVSLVSLRLRQEEERRKALADQSYLQALRQAERQRLGGQAIRVAETLEDAADDDPLLRASLERARQAHLQKRQASAASTPALSSVKRESGAADDPAVRLRNQLQQFKQAIKQEPRMEDGSGDDGTSSSARPPTAAAEETNDDEVAFTETSEFCDALESTVDEMRQQREQRRRLRELSRGVKQEAVEASSGRRKDWRMDVDEDRSSDDDDDGAEDGRVKSEAGSGGGSDEQDADPRDRKEEELFFTAEDELGSGLAEFLQRVKHRGLLQPKESQFGRNKDRELDLDADDPAPHLKLGVYDEAGNLLKPKEAFRYISHAFHGHRPGAKKREKRLKELKERNRGAQDIDAIGSFAGMRRSRDGAEEVSAGRAAKRQK